MKNTWFNRVVWFYIAVYVVSALLWLPVVISGKGMALPVNQALLALFTFVPSITGIVFTYLTKDAQGRRDFWRRVIRWPRGKGRMIFLILITAPAINLLAYSLPTLWEGKGITLRYAAELFTNLPLLAQFLIVEILFGAVSEELGWRGYLLDELQSRWSALKSSLVLGIFWALWHTPAFLIPGLSQYEMGGIFSWQYVSFILAVTAASILHTWAYNNTGRSILVAGVLMHFLSNATMIFMGGIFDRFTVPDGYWLAWPALSILAACVIVVIYGAKTLRREAYSAGFDRAKAVE